MKKLITAIIILSLSTVYLNASANQRTLTDSAKTSFDDNSKFKLFINGQTYDLISYNFTYMVADKKIPPPTNLYIQTSTITVTMRTSKIDQKLFDWTLSSMQDEKDAKIVVYDGDSGKEIKTITFSGLTTASYSENGTTLTNFGIQNTQQTNFSFRYKTVSVTLGK